MADPVTGLEPAIVPDSAEYLDLQEAHHEIRRLLDAGIALDQRELDIAVSELKGYCDAGYDPHGSNSVWASIKADAEAAWQATRPPMAKFLAMINNPDDLVGTVCPQWASIVGRLLVIEETIPELSTAGWQSGAADGYRTKLEPHRGNVAQIRALAANAHNSLVGVAQLQAAILSAGRKTLENHRLAISSYHAEVGFDAAGLRAHFEQSYFDFRLNNQEQYSFPFFRRTLYADTAITELAGYLHNLANKDAAVWVPASQGIGATLDEATAAARAGVVPALGDYSADQDYASGEVSTGDTGRGAEMVR